MQTPEQRAISNRKWRHKTRKDWLAFLGKDGMQCLLCGFSNPDALVYHHLNPKNKKFNVSKFIRSKPCTLQNQRTLLEEIDKCILVCCNCHAIIHARQRRKEQGIKDIMAYA